MPLASVWSSAVPPVFSGGASKRTVSNFPFAAQPPQRRRWLLPHTLALRRFGELHSGTERSAGEVCSRTRHLALCAGPSPCHLG